MPRGGRRWPCLEVLGGFGGLGWCLEGFKVLANYNKNPKLDESIVNLGFLCVGHTSNIGLGGVWIK